MSTGYLGSSRVPRRYEHMDSFTAMILLWLDLLTCRTVLIDLRLLRTTQGPQPSLLQARHLSGERGGGRKGFLGEFLDNLKQELNKNKEMKENLRKFREEAKRLEESDALQQARRKYVSD